MSGLTRQEFLAGLTKEQRKRLDGYLNVTHTAIDIKTLEELERKANAFDFLATTYHSLYDKNGKYVCEVYGVEYAGDTVLEAVEAAMGSEDE